MTPADIWEGSGASSDPDPSQIRRAAVIGGGIAGLVAARELAMRGATVDLYEADSRVGGKIETVEIAGRHVDAGADSFLARVPDAVDLCIELGLGADLVAPAAAEAGVWVDDAVRPLPAGLVLGVPARIGPLARSGILSPLGVARAAAEPLLPRTRWSDDIGVGALVRRRFGREVHERLVDPLLGGINAGRSEELSIEVGAPQLASVARSSRSLLLGLRRLPASVDGPVFNSLRAGVGRLVDALAADVQRRGAEIHLGTAVESLADIDADVVVIAAPAFAAARLVTGRAAALTSTITYSSVVLVTMVFDQAALPRPPEGTGFLVARGEGRLMTACSYGSNKWLHWSSPEHVVLRVSAGRAGDERAMGMSDDDVVTALLAELREAIGVTKPPLSATVRRWPDAFPQFAVGHLSRMKALDAALPPHLAVAGAWTRGVGIPACIRSGRAAADRVLRQ